MIRARAVVASALLTAVLSGCASSRLSSEPPAGVSLAGDWKVDAAASDDLGKAVASLEAQGRRTAQHRKGEQQEIAGQGEAPPAGGQWSHRGGQNGQEPGSDNESAGGAGQGGGGGPAPHASAVDELMSNVPQGDYLKITVSPEAFTVTSGDSSDQYLPGVESDISAEQGDAVQISGWKGQAYVIDTKPEFGPEITQSYGLRKDGKLAMTLRLSARGTDFTFTRVYDRTARVAPLAPPTNN